MIQTLLLSIFFMLMLPAAPLPMSQSKSADNWDAWRFLIGDWVGEGDGAPGQATGGFSFNLDLQGRILVRKNRADYPATKDRAAFLHEDLMIVYLESEGKPVKAIYFDNEGHVINYTATLSADGKTVTLLSDAAPSAPRYRFIYNKTTNDKLSFEFDIAPPGKPDAFSKYVEGAAKRKGAS